MKANMMERMLLLSATMNGAAEVTEAGSGDSVIAFEALNYEVGELKILIDEMGDEAEEIEVELAQQLLKLSARIEETFLLLGP